MLDKYYSLMVEHPEFFNNSDDPEAIKIITDKTIINKVSKELDTPIGIIYEDAYISLLKDVVSFPDNSLGTYIRVLNFKKSQGIVILPVWDDKILLLKHYRHAIRRFNWELPRGFSNDDESIIDNAKRELFEECGLKSANEKILGKVTADSGILGGEPWIVKAEITDCQFTNNSNESIEECKWFSIVDVLQWISENIITDSYTIAAVMMAICKKELDSVIR